MPVFADVKTENNTLIRKAIDTFAAVAPYSIAAITTPFTGTTNALAALPASYSGLGWLSDDGISLGRDVELSEISALGSTEPVRIDTRRVAKTLTCTALETSKLTRALYYGMNPTATITPNAGGVVEYTEPDQPIPNYVRLLAYSKDETENGEIYIVRSYPRARVTPNGEQVWSDGDAAMSYPLLFTATKDPVLGYSVKEWQGGPGSTGLNTAMGYVGV